MAIFQIWMITKLRANISNVLENTKTFFPTGKYLYSHDSVMQTLLFILSTCTRSEYRTKILNTPQNVLDWNNIHYFAGKPDFKLMYDNARKLGSALTVWLVENWKAISCLVVIVEVTGLAVFYFNQVYLILKIEKLISWVSKVLQLLREPEVSGIFYLEGQKTFLATSDFKHLFWPLKLQIYHAWYSSMISSLFEKVSYFDGFNVGKIPQN